MKTSLLKKQLKVRLPIFLVTSLALLLYIMFIDPSEGGFIIILGPVILAWVVGFLVLLTGIDVVFTHMSGIVKRFIAAAVTSALLFFVLLSGIGTIGPVDVVLTSSLVLLTGFYVARLWQ